MAQPDQNKIRTIDLSPDALTLLQKRRDIKSNIVRTSRYTWYTFLPFNLFEQFTKKLSNVYFLVIMFMQMIPMISISNGQPAMAPPLAFVVVLSMIKDAYEDYKRHKEDDGENSAKASVYNRAQKNFTIVDWRDIRVGDIVRVGEKEFFPSDMVIIKSSEPEGGFYVETKNLDGETNLKLKATPKGMQQFCPDDNWEMFDGCFNIEQPNNRIYKFDGNFKHASSQSPIPLSNDDVALRGMSLRNTEFVIGVVVYTGHDSKIQMNSAGAVYKSSNIMRITNRQILYVFLIQIILASIGSIIGSTWMVDNLDTATYLNFNKNDSWNSTWGLLFIKTTGTWILIFTNFVPISLIVTLEIVKFWQGSFMGYDLSMYDADQDFPTKAQTTNINEELGQIEYIFSDKTGTLTCNIMEFKKFSGRAGSFNFTEEGGPAKQENGLNFIDKAGLDLATKDTSHPAHTSVEEIMIILALCHAVVIDKRSGKMNSASPDELALVEGAASQGYKFTGVDAKGVINVERKRDGKILRYELLNTLEFDSTRKRMSVIVRDLQTQEIRLICKGADSIVKDRLDLSNRENSDFMDKTQKFVDAYAEEGLRTLLCAVKPLDQNYYAEWNTRFQQAQGLVVGKDEAVEKCSSEIESKMLLSGSTAIEDRLQENVKDTIEAFKETGIKVWVLTGDKVETAINIGYSCGLLNNDMEQYVINTVNHDEIQTVLRKIWNNRQQGKVPAGKKEALVIAGEALTKVQDTPDLKSDFLKVTDFMDVVVACRVSPKQKGDIVQMIRQRFPNKMTLAVGDGANDVAMILKAHVGVGIAGREGMQAARSSDYAIGKFKFLKPLLFCHGREAYRRISWLVCYNFYKNILYVIVQYYFGFYSVFSGQTLYEPWAYQLYNVAFTGAALFWWGVFDWSYTKERLMQDPSLYKVGLEGRLFSTKVFWSWQLYALLQAVIILFLGMVFTQESPCPNGKSYTFWAGGHVVYFECVLIANLVLLRNTHNFSGWGELLIALQVASYFLFIWIDSIWLTTAEIAYFYDEFMSSWTAWLGCVLVGCLIYVEKSVMDCVTLWNQSASQQDAKVQDWNQVKSYRVNLVRNDNSNENLLNGNERVNMQKQGEIMALYNKFDDESSILDGGIELQSRSLNAGLKEDKTPSEIK